MFKMRIILLLLSSITVVKCASFYQSSKYFKSIVDDKESYRLPKNATASKYKIVLYVDPEDSSLSFEGKVEMDVNVHLNQTDSIVLHSKDLHIENITVKTVETEANITKSYGLSQNDKDFLTIVLKSHVHTTTLLSVSIAFKGTFSKNLDGLYTSHYTENDENKILAVTLMAPSSARKMFPCFDEPGIKATFQINVYAPSKYKVFSNEDLATSSNLSPTFGNLNLTAFKETKPMSTYLVALLISDFTSKSNIGEQQIFSKTYRILAKQSASDEMDFALEFGQKAMWNLENYTDVPYTFTKLDNAAVPNLFYNAMENWGLIVYREERLLYNKSRTSTSELQLIGTVVAHESAHMWFGNKVTPSWWDYVWLNEGFASYFELIITDQIKPEWRVMDQFTINKVHRAMNYDSREETNAMTHPIGSAEEAMNNYNIIAYQKAASVIRMMSHVLGEENFRTGLSNYLKEKTYGVVVPDDLFTKLDEAIEIDGILPNSVTVGEIFASWSNQKGYPIVKTFKIENSKYIALTQERAFENTSLSSSERWWIPITWTTSKEVSFENTQTQSWFNPNSGMLRISIDLGENDWYIINKQQIGYYRVMYYDNNWKLLSEALSTEYFGGIHLLNRVQILDDSLFFSKTLELSYNVMFGILKYLEYESDYIPWYVAQNGFNHLSPLMVAAKHHDKYKMFIRQLSQRVYDRLTLNSNENDNHFSRLQRPVIASLVCGADHEGCLTETNNKLNSHVTQSTILDVDLKEVIYCYGMRKVSQGIWDTLWTKSNDLATPDDEKRMIRNCLAYSSDTNIILKYLLNAINEQINLTKTERTNMIISVINSGPDAYRILLDRMPIFFSSIKQNTNIKDIFREFGNKLVTTEDENKFKNIIANSSMTTEEKEFGNLMLVKISENIKWLQITLQDIDPWLDENVYSGSRKIGIISNMLLSSSLLMVFIISFLTM